MTIPFQIGRYLARLAADADDLTACQALRHLCFFGRDGIDADDHDSRCQHLMIMDARDRLVGAARLMLVPDAAAMAHSYAAQSYDLTAFARTDGVKLELGRFCIRPGLQDADVLRVAWAALAQIVDQAQVQHLFGCTSFAGIDASLYARAFARLGARHQGPDDLRPGVRAAEVVHLARMTGKGDAPMPSLLRSYLAMGGWVGDHAVVDRRMQTLHVFTCVDIAAVPPARARALRAVTAGC
jgi:putative hemolysin